MSNAHPCFFYGSLMDRRVLDAVTRPEPGADHYTVRASISGFIRHPYRTQPYPGMIPAKDPSHIVEGLLVFGHSEIERHRLDQFEGSEYPRSVQKVTVLDPVPAKYAVHPDQGDIAAGTVIEAFAYVFSGPLEHLDLTREWDFEAFKRDSCAKWISASPDFANMIDRSTAPFESSVLSPLITTNTATATAATVATVTTTDVLQA
ncbi:hypothetical protein BGW42_001589 [Actinomortierella wolfii]|nr:hypothetical protein BGW42_001589 [Actinomortierella wolfii]